MGRPVTRRYADPLDVIWIEAARRIGFGIDRSDDVFAGSDGRGTITIAAAEHLDADDCLAQMILHELCHSLVQGPGSFEVADWGLENVDDRDTHLEHACLRTQAHLTQRHGLREVLAPTTDFRAFYDALGPDPLAPRQDASSLAAVIAIGRADRAPWSPHLTEALAATAGVARAGRAHWPADSLLGRLGANAEVTAAGLPRRLVGNERCGDCGWRDDATGRCQQALVPVTAGEPACERFETTVDCLGCGACCREGFDSVTITDNDPVRVAHPGLVVTHPTYFELARVADGAADRCVALDGKSGSFRCRIYEDRPLCCRELERGGEHCLTARRRVGLSL